MRLHHITALLLVPAFTWTIAAAQDTTRSTSKTQDSTTLRQSSDSQMEQLSDDAVLMRMHRTNQMEIKAGRLAQSHGGSAKVRAFGARLVRDHSANDQKVVALAKKLGITLAREGMESTEHAYGRRGRMGRTNREGRDSTYAMDRGRDSTYGMPRTDTTAREGYRRGDSTEARGEMREHAGRADLQQLSTLRGAAFDSTFTSAMVEGHTKAINMLEQAQTQVQHEELRSLIAASLPTIRQHLETAQSLSTSAGATSSR
jgi:predicted outer membrane protein